MVGCGEIGRQLESSIVCCTRIRATGRSYSRVGDSLTKSTKSSAALLGAMVAVVVLSSRCGSGVVTELRLGINEEATGVDEARVSCEPRKAIADMRLWL